MVNIRGICLEGGGSTGIAHVGALEVLEDTGILENITHFVGSSAGSIAAAVLSCGADADYMRKILVEKNFTHLLDSSPCLLVDFVRLTKSFGYYKGDALKSWLGTVLKELTGSPDVTFAEAHAQFGTFLEVTVTDLTMGTVYISHLTHPDMMIRTAVHRSSCMPFVFKSPSDILDTKFVKDDKIITEKKRHFYIDGGLLDNYPIHRLYEHLPKEECVGLKLMTSNSLYELENPEISEFADPPSNIVEFIKIVTTMVRNQALKLHVEEEDWVRTVKIDVGTMSSTDFELSDEDKEFLFNQGKEAAKKYIESL